MLAEEPVKLRPSFTAQRLAEIDPAHENPDGRREGGRLYAHLDHRFLLDDLLFRNSPDKSRTGVNDSNFLDCLEARREVRTASGSISNTNPIAVLQSIAALPRIAYPHNYTDPRLMITRSLIVFHHRCVFSLKSCSVLTTSPCGKRWLETASQSGRTAYDAQQMCCDFFNLGGPLVMQARTADNMSKRLSGMATGTMHSGASLPAAKLKQLAWPLTTVMVIGESVFCALTRTPSVAPSSTEEN